MSSELEHYGVKGMKWGVRKKSSGGSNSKKSDYSVRREELLNRQLYSTSVKAKNGKEVVAIELPMGKVSASIMALSPKLAKSVESSKNLEFSVDGEKIGDGSVERRSKDEMYLNWIGVDSKHRGNGYASALFDVAVKHSIDEGATKLTLEVPGKSPDARHIYEKRGFKVSGPMEGSKNDIWGGLTPMTLDVTKKSIKHEDLDDEFDAALLETFDILYDGNKPFEDPENLAHEFLEHYGVKGMKWGVRKDKAGGGGVMKRSTPPKPSTDKAEVNRASSKIAKGNTDALSNKELQKVVKRMNLEKQYKDLAGSNQAQGGKAQVKAFLRKEGQKVVNDIVNTQRQRLAKELIKKL